MLVTTPSSSSADIKQLSHLIQGFRVAMLTTICTDGTLHSRPMATQDAPFDGTLWFFTSLNAPKVGELQNDCQVNVSYADPGEHRYVSVSGRAELVSDRTKIKEKWSPHFDEWFPNGLEDPQMALVHVDVVKAEFWDSKSHAMIQIDGPIKIQASEEDCDIRNTVWET